VARIFGIDASSFQGNVNWAEVDRACDFGAEKVTEGTGYENPFWPVAKQAMLARAHASGFVPMAYMFLDAGERGEAQADWFASKAGSLDGFAIVIDVERASDGSPTLTQAKDAATRLRQHYPRHPIGGYIPHWFSGSRDLGFVDWLWASSYVGGSGAPEVLYHGVPDLWWAPYGGAKPTLLQFTDKAVVGGVGGQVDCSAFLGTVEQLGRLVLARPVIQQPPPVPTPKPVPLAQPVTTSSGHADSTMLFVKPGAPKISIPVHAQEAPGTPPPWAHCSLVLAGDSGAVVQAVLHRQDGTSRPVIVPLSGGKAAKVDANWPNIAVVTLHRLDTKTQLGATARFITW
jgi:GH25 family lysozyme M1 (1,4-beta-N-acetylmuramidase)